MIARSLAVKVALCAVSLGVILVTPLAFASDDEGPSTTPFADNAQFAADILSEYFEHNDSGNYLSYAVSANSVTFYFDGAPSPEVDEVVFREIADKYPDVEVIVRDDAAFSYENYIAGAYELFEFIQQRDGFTTVAPAPDNRGIVIGIDPAIDVPEAVLAEVIEEARSIFGDDIDVKFELIEPAIRGFF